MENFQRIKVVGKGSYGEVWLSKHNRDKKQYVLKKMDLKKASKRERKAAEQEAKLLSQLKHPNIVGYKDSFEDDGYLWIAMSFCEGGDLYNSLKARKGTLLEERQIVEWFVQISMALQYLHERNVLHRDLKTQNIFLTRSKIIKLGDLGIARVLDSSNDMATTLIGTPYYMSPELFSNKPYNHKSDVWALGCCVYEMATLKHAFNAKDMNSLVYKILRGKVPPMPVQYSQELTNLIRAMLDQNPARRPTVNKILRDPFIKRNIAIFLEGTRKSRRTSSAVKSQSQGDGRVEVLSSESSRIGSGGRHRDRPSSGDQKKRSRPFDNPIAVEKPRPLPIAPNHSGGSASTKLPKSAASTPLTPGSDQDPFSVGGSQSEELDEGQRTNPNMSARARRRERSMREETPRNSYEGIQNIRLEPRRKGSATSERGDSAKSDRGHRRLPSDVTDAARLSNDINANSKPEAKEGKPRRQASIADDDEESSQSFDNDVDREKRSEEKEEEHFERMLDATLHIQVDMDDDTLEIEEAAAAPPKPIHHVKSEPVIGEQPIFSKETLNSSGRLMERIVALRKDCLKGVGLEKLHKSCQILDDIDSDNMEARLIELLGAALFDDYAGKIWQLKFCEESAFRIN